MMASLNEPSCRTATEHCTREPPAAPVQDPPIPHLASGAEEVLKSTMEIDSSVVVVVVVEAVKTWEAN